MSWQQNGHGGMAGGGGMFPSQMQAFGNPYGGGYGGGGRGRGRRDDRRGGGGGGGRGRGGFGGRGDDRNERPESSSNRIKKMIIKFADEDDFHPIEDPPRLARALRRQWKEGQAGIFEGFRIGVTQEPHKHPHYVSLLTHLSRQRKSENSPDGDIAETEEPQTGEKRKLDEEDPECGKEILEDLSRAFRGWVEGREWMNMRLSLHFFSLLVPAGLVSPGSLIEVYKALLSVLDEVGGGGDRAERVIRAVAEGLIRSGHALNDVFAEDVEAIFTQLETAINSRVRRASKLNDPFSPLLAPGQERESSPEVLSDLLNALTVLRESGYATPACLPRHWEAISAVDEGIEQSAPFDLTAVNMPPEMYDLDEKTDGESAEGRAGQMSFFGEDVVLPASTPAGWTLRSLVLDIAILFEINRKECARVLLALPTFLPPNTFKPAKPSEENTSTLSLESLIISTLLSAMLVLPTSSLPLIFYASLITELCKASPNTVAPPVGRAVRKLYGLMGADGLDCEVQKRVGDWLSIHLSNFGFQWMWKEWVPDIELPTAHPKRAFMRRVVDLEVRLAYHDRILQSLPEPMQDETAGVVSKDAPDPFWQYEQADHPLHAEAVELLKLYRQKTTAGDVRAHLLTLPDATAGPGEPLAKAITLMATETLLQLGSRSFSHFLNATERYLDLLRSLSPDPASRQTILQAVASYWRRSGQMRLMTIDKYLQYGVLEAVDVVDWVFTDDESGGEVADGWTDGHKWDILRMCLDKSVGRVTAVKRRARAVERDDENAKARRAAEKLDRGEGVGEDEDVEPVEARLERSKEARDAQISLDIQASKLEAVLLATARHFASALCPWRFEAEGEVQSQGLKAAFELLGNGIEGAWSARCVLGWYKHFLRAYSNQLAPLAGVVKDKTFGSFVGEADASASTEGQAEQVVKDLWAQAVGN